MLFDTEVKNLIVEDGSVVGVVAQDKDGEIRAKAKAVVIAAGGYQDNKEWVDKILQVRLHATGDSR